MAFFEKNVKSLLGWCDSGYTLYDISCYKLTANSLTYSDVVSSCSLDGRNLVTINSDTYCYTGTDGKGLWIGFNDHATEGSFVWVHGTSTYVNWYPLEPNNGNGGNEDCGVIGYNPSARSQWNDLACTNLLIGVCKKLFPTRQFRLTNLLLNQLLCPLKFLVVCHRVVRLFCHQFYSQYLFNPQTLRTNQFPVMGQEQLRLQFYWMLLTYPWGLFLWLCCHP